MLQNVIIFEHWSASKSVGQIVLVQSSKMFISLIEGF